VTIYNDLGNALHVANIGLDLMNAQPDLQHKTIICQVRIQVRFRD